ncbi:hypothetical protein [Streptomyces sp. CB01881]|uniref:hypothetical protein n=1 Tax=Streptomyces sp. CB01881 TaxID=2078691 RepID=UPI000CDC022F|nr:hypothetical protein [Streptomyces sp. CB01881]AUY49334.1 hypothetical protein C2142_10755 [Streptomyces sp. CB01881]TYC72722.1 hypothetical protein EH183_10750 [Streptomyces sp. CB01881]
MAQTFTGWQQTPAPHRGERVWPWLLVGAAEVLAAAPMLTMVAGGGLVAGVMGLAAGSSAADVLLLVLMLALGPLLGVAVPALLLLVPAVRRTNAGALFALHCTGLLLGTAVEYFTWIRPAMG